MMLTYCALPTGMLLQWNDILPSYKMLSQFQQGKHGKEVLVSMGSLDFQANKISPTQSRSSPYQQSPTEQPE